MNNGFISLHRKILDWEWYQDSIVRSVFIHILLKANYSDQKWQGIDIKRGQLITSYPHLSEQLSNKYNKLSIQQVRTALDKLKSTGELTVKTTNKYSLITVNNYSEYQQINSQDNSQITGKQQTSNRQVTTNNKDNKEKKDNKNISKDISLKTEYGNPYINELLEYMKNTLELPKLNGTIQSNRNQAFNLIREFKKTYNCDEAGAVEKIKIVISYIPRHEFWNGKINDFMALKRNWVTLLNSLKEEKQNARNKFATME